MASLVVVTGPAIDPVSLTDAKAHLRVTNNSEDAVIGGKLKAARRWCEHHCRRGFITQTLRLRFDSFPELIRLPYGACASITSITYVDEDGVTQTLASGRYQSDLDGMPARVGPAYGYNWPATRAQMNAVAVTYVVGAATADDDVKAAVLMVLADLYENREASIIAATYAPNPAVLSLLSPHRCDILGLALSEPD